MTKPLPRAILFALIAIVIVMASTFVWLMVDLLMSGGQVTQPVVDRAYLFWIIAGALVTFWAERRAQI